MLPNPEGIIAHLDCPPCSLPSSLVTVVLAVRLPVCSAVSPHASLGPPCVPHVVVVPTPSCSPRACSGSPSLSPMPSPPASPTRASRPILPAMPPAPWCPSAAHLPSSLAPAPAREPAPSVASRTAVHGIRRQPVARASLSLPLPSPLASRRAARTPRLTRLQIQWRPSAASTQAWVRTTRLTLQRVRLSL